MLARRRQALLFDKDNSDIIVVVIILKHCFLTGKFYRAGHFTMTTFDYHHLMVIFY